MPESVTARDVASVIITETVAELLVAIEDGEDFSGALAAHRRALDALADIR